jgi:hypothetical protein
MVYGTPDFDKTLLKIIKTTRVTLTGEIEDDSKTAFRHPCYHECCEHAEEMSWHLYGEEPTDLLKRSRPREDPAVTAYRIENYEPLTKASADKAINIVSKIFNPNLYSIIFPKDSGAKELEQYTIEDYPVFNSVVNFTKDVVLRKMLADPNGVMAVKLQSIPESDVEMLEPIVVTYGSESIYNYDVDHFLIFISTEAEKIKQQDIVWFTFEYFDNNQYINFRCYKTATDKLIIQELDSYKYNFGEIPVWFLGGMPESEDNGTIIYKSFFSSALPYWNQSVIHESDVMASYIGHIFPQKWELSDPCTFKGPGGASCRGGLIKGVDGNYSDCPACEGTGYKQISPLGVYRFEREKLSEDGPLGMAPVGYVPVPVDATKMLEERAHKMRELAMWAINMDVEDSVGEVQSGVAKTIDRSAQYDSLYNIATITFDTHLTNEIYFINKFRFGTVASSSGKSADNNLPQINKPTQFDIVSTTELINNFTVASKSGLDRNYLQNKQVEILTRDMTTNPELKKLSSLLLDLDPLPGLDYLTISQNVSRGFNSQVDAVIHFNIKKFVEEAINADKGFEDKPKQDQYLALEVIANDFISNNKPKLDTSMLPPINTNKNG